MSYRTLRLKAMQAASPCRGLLPLGLGIPNSNATLRGCGILPEAHKSSRDLCCAPSPF